MAETPLEILLVEDSTGDRRLIEEMLAGGEAYLTHLGREGSPQLVTESRLEPALDYLTTTTPDAVLLDLNLPDSAGLETLSAVLETVDMAPVIVLTGVRDRELGVEALQRGAQDFLVKDEVTEALLGRTIFHAIERARQERAREARREELELLNRLNRITGDVTRAVIRADSREDLEQRVCDRLAAEDAFSFAWIGEIQPGSDELVPEAVAGTGSDYPDAIEVHADGGQLAQGPGGRAATTGEVQFVQDVRQAKQFEPWREAALERGFHSVAGIPILAGDVVEGVIGVYADEPNAFAGPEPGVFARLGEIVGHALVAMERREALVSERVIQMEFLFEGMLESVRSLTRDFDGSIEVEHLLQHEDRLFAYSTVSGIPRERLEATAEQSSALGPIRSLSGGDQEYDIEIEVRSVVQLLESAAGYGVRFDSATFEDGELRIVVEIPRHQNPRRIIEVFEDDVDAELLAQRTVERDPPPDLETVYHRHLTDKQRQALEMAFHSGYFDWPRGSSGEELADRLDVSAATFSQHLRSAERKVFAKLLKDEESVG